MLVVRFILAAALGASLFMVRLSPLPSREAVADRRSPGGGQANAVERGALRLHYVQKPIGYERYEVAHDGDALTLTSDFDFTDRGGRVQLTATLRTAPDFTLWQGPWV